MESRNTGMKKSLKKQLWEKLMEYGDGVLQDEKKFKRKTKIKKGIKKSVRNPKLDSHEINIKFPETESWKPQHASADCDTSEHNLPTLGGKDKHLHRFKVELGLLDTDVVRSGTEEPLSGQHSISKTKNVHDNGNHRKRAPVEIVVFEEPRKRKKKNETRVVEPKESIDSSNLEEDSGIDFDLKKAMLEVHKFGITGFEKEQKEEAMKAFLIKLGAKGPKNKHMNYKELMEMKKKEKEENIQRSKESGSKEKSMKSRSNRKKKTDDRVKGFLDGQIGQYKSGVQVVSKDEIKATKAKKTRKK